MTPQLARTRPKPPVRMVHLGLGNFFRAHQAWYTQHSSDAAEWGYAAFGGRATGTAATLRAQDNLYTIAFTGSHGDTYECIESISSCYDTEDHQAWVELCAAPSTSIISTTVTEAGYRASGAHGVNLDDPEVLSDIAKLRAGRIDVVTAPARLVAGLRARRAANAGAVALMSCDNLQENGVVMRDVTRAMAQQIDPTLLAWIDATVSFVTTMVDRITPRPTNEDFARVATAIGGADPAAIVAEPFGEWVIEGEFPAGRPDWATAGVTFTDDIAAHERRKLWLLNGSHSMLAYVGLSRGLTTVAEAMADRVCRDIVHDWWRSAIDVLGSDRAQLMAYTDALTERYDNPRIRHLLAQIGTDGSMKIAVRWMPAVTALRARGILPGSVVQALAAYTLYVQRGDVRDVAKAALDAAVDAEPITTLRNIIAIVAPDLLLDVELMSAVATELERTLHATS
jgi:fructuronate reductase